MKNIDKQEPDMPLSTHKETDGAASIEIYEPYTPWVLEGSHVGILPIFLAKTVGFRVPTSVEAASILMLILLCFYVAALVVAYVASKNHMILNLLDKSAKAIYLFLHYPITFMAGFFHLVVLFVVCAIFWKRDIFWAPLSPGLALYGFSIYLLYFGAVNESSYSWSFWTVGSTPQSFRGCNPRVEPQQSILFTEDTYSTQFARLGSVVGRSNATLTFDSELFRSIQTNQTLCEHGFVGSADLYGLGIRAGIYLQWMTCIIANNLLSEKRQELRKVYVVFSLAMCIATIVSSFAVTCVFSIEILILYWMYWGGVLMRLCYISKLKSAWISRQVGRLRPSDSDPIHTSRAHDVPWGLVNLVRLRPGFRPDALWHLSFFLRATSGP